MRDVSAKVAGVQSAGPSTRHQALIGDYRQTWSVIEDKLRGAVGTALSLNSTQQAVRASNVPIRDAIELLKTVVHVRFGNNPEKCDAYVSLLDNIAKEARVRDIVAHDLFERGRDKEGVESPVEKAKAMRRFPVKVLSITDSEVARTRIAEYAQQLTEMISVVVTVQRTGGPAGS